MSMHAVHKILANASGEKSVKAGDIVTAKVDLAGINDVYKIVIDSFKEMGGTKVWDPSKVVIFQDHNAPSATLVGAENQKAYRIFAEEQGIQTVYEVECGICHEVAAQAGIIRPGMIVVITDSHTTTHGALGCLSSGLGATDLAVTLMEGELWFKVPEIINIRLEGTMPAGVAAKDISLYILGKLGTDFANYRVIEFSGPVVDRLPIEERMVLCNMAVEMGAKSGYIQPDKKTLDFVTARTKAPFTVFETDADYQYDITYTYNLDTLEPLAAFPGRVDSVYPVREANGVHIDQVFIGSCTGGRLTDIAVAAKVLSGKHIAKGTRLIVTMASKEVLQQSIELGYMQQLLSAGAVITPPTCGPCYGTHAGVLAAGERAVSTSSRNYPGRMGSEAAEIYLVSSLTAAVTALTGKLTDPRDMVTGG